MNKWQALCDSVLATYKKEMKKKPKDRIKKNLKKAPGRHEARKHAAMAGMKSIGEVRCAADMDARGIKWHYEHEKLEYTIDATYNPDFTLYANDDKLIEYKGKMTQTVRTKLLAIKRSNPDRQLYLVFEKPDNKLSSRPKSLRYWEWAERNGFEWSDQVIREEWI